MKILAMPTCSNGLFCFVLFDSWFVSTCLQEGKKGRKKVRKEGKGGDDG